MGVFNFMVLLILQLVILCYLVQGFTGSGLHPSAAVSPLPVPITNKGIVPSSSPNVPTTIFPPHNMAPPPLMAKTQGHEPSLSPSTSIVFPAPHDTTLPPSSTPTRREITPPPSIARRDEPLMSPNTVIVSPPHETTPPPLIIGGDVMPPPAPSPFSSSPYQARIPSSPPNVPQRRLPINENIITPSGSAGYFSPESSPQTSPREATRHNFRAPFPFSPKSAPNEEYHSPSPLPSTPHHKEVRHTYDAPFSSPPKHNPNEEHHSPTYPPSSASSHHVSPRTSENKGPVISPANIQTSSYAPPLLRPASSFSPSYSPHSESVSHVSPVPSSSPLAASGHYEMPGLAPKVSPSGSLPNSPKMPPLPLIYTLPPPPPNQDCAATTCQDPYTTTPPGVPCSCVLPIQIGLRLSVPLYTFFPLVSELAEEISVGVFVNQSQVRIMGANAAQQPEETVALIYLLPLGNKFDNTTAFSTYQRFWHKQVDIKASLFGDYEVLYVRYPGLPAPPPSIINMIDGRPYNSNQDGNTIKPLGVDVHRRQHNKGLSGGVVAIIVLSGFMTLILGCAIAWVLLIKHRDNGCMRVQAPHISRSLNPKPSGLARSITGSGRGLSSDSLSFGSSIAPYTGSAKTFSSSDLDKATDNFNDSRILGEGGFGRVYYGVLEDGTKVAVKVLKRDDQQGGREFLAEVEMLSRLHHRNLVKLIGICTEEKARSLVYELVPNGSVESHLHGSNFLVCLILLH
ncbi:hypothetical protein ACFE04_017871 [Oxalis oulophora]